MLRQMEKLAASLAVLLMLNTAAAVASNDGERHLILNKHPKLRKMLKLGAIGAATGGAGAVVLGRSVGTGMATGAGTKYATHAAKKKLNKDRD